MNQLMKQATTNSESIATIASVIADGSSGSVEILVNALVVMISTVQLIVIEATVLKE